MANWWGAAKSLAGSIGDAADHLGRARDAFFDPNAMKAAVKEIASGRGGQDIREGGWRRKESRTMRKRK